MDVENDNRYFKVGFRSILFKWHYALVINSVVSTDPFSTEMSYWTTFICLN